MLAGVAAAILLTGLPAYIVLLAASVIGAVAGLGGGVLTTDLLGALGPRLINLLENDLLQALPLYLLVGALLIRLPVADALFRTLAALMRQSPAAPLLAGLGLGALIAPMSGSVGASVLAIARTIGPRLERAGVPPAQREAVIAVASTLGVVVPPSLVLILLGDAMLTAHTIANNATGRAERIINTQDIFRGALLPAGLFVLLALGVAWLMARRETRQDAQRVVTPSRADVAVSLATLAFLVLLLGGVAVGRFYAVEAAATGAFVLLSAGLLTRRLKVGQLSAVLSDVLTGTGVLFAPLLAATTFTLVLRLLGTDRLIESFIVALPGGPLLPVVVILAAIGLSAFALDAFEIIFVVVPLLVPPLLMRAGDAVWVGVLVLLVLQASYLLPPIGYALLLTRGQSKAASPMAALTQAVLPFLAAQLVVLVLVLLMPRMVHGLDPADSSSRKGAATLSKPELDQQLRQIVKPQQPAPAGPRF